MENYGLTEKDYQILKELLKINKKIKSIYDNLYKLEICHSKDNEEYKEVIKSLKQEIIKENKIYELIGKDIERLYAYANYIFPNGICELDEEIEVLKNDNSSELIKLRVAKRINDLINEFVFEDFEDEYDSLNCDDEMDCEEEFRKDCLIQKTIEEDIVNTILVILNKYINNPNCSIVKDKLIKFKYNVAYTNKIIEYYILNNNFIINDNLYLKSIFISDIERKDKEDTLATFYDYVNNLCHFEIDELIRLLNINDKSNIILTLIIIRSCLVYIHNKKVDNTKKILELEILLSSIDNELIINLINDMFVENNKDKEIPQILSLRP